MRPNALREAIIANAMKCIVGEHEAEVAGILVQFAHPSRDQEWEASVKGFRQAICKHCRCLYVEKEC